MNIVLNYDLSMNFYKEISEGFHMSSMLKNQHTHRCTINLFLILSSLVFYISFVK